MLKRCRSMIGIACVASQLTSPLVLTSAFTPATSHRGAASSRPFTIRAFPSTPAAVETKVEPVTRSHVESARLDVCPLTPTRALRLPAFGTTHIHLTKFRQHTSLHHRRTPFLNHRRGGQEAPEIRPRYRGT